ncbi:hypothetical protein O77CONTIG1_00732 [Leptolyngbya sp. O-77]|nr:hypothetical protein O77CONTIG1_00732 [Leptolyngbya sp. O-77]
MGKLWAIQVQGVCLDNASQGNRDFDEKRETTPDRDNSRSKLLLTVTKGALLFQECAPFP